MNLRFQFILFFLFSFSYNQDCCEAEEIAMNDCEGMTGCYIPQCLQDCSWEPMQCWASTGYCWCVDDNGVEIEGTSTPSWQGFPDCSISNCDEGYIEINDLCFHEGDLNVIQKMIDNSYASNIDLDCQDGDDYCGSPNPFMDSLDNWMWISFDGVVYEISGNENGLVEPVELGIQDWENGRLVSLMCGAYIYCQLSGPIPEEVNMLTELETFRVEGNYFSGFIPESICDLDINYSNSLEFDVRYNQLCPPYPNCIDPDQDFWGQYDEACSEIGDINFDSLTNILDIILLVSTIIENTDIDYQIMIASDINQDGVLNVLDVVGIVNIILN